MIKHLYIHIPFCNSICPYCDFHKRVSNNDIKKKYRDALIKEIEINKDNFSDIETIYIGGGTPTSYNYLLDILDTLKCYIDLKRVKEFTIESTPETILDYYKEFNKYNINRISIGIESFNKETLSYLKRNNTSYESIKDIMDKLKKEGINNINLDLIYSLPYETMDSIKNGLNIIKKLNPNHISYYDLIIEENTILTHDYKKKLIKECDEDLNISMRDYIEKELKVMGYNQYEISNYSKKGYESIHNISYWTLENYLSLGSGSHSLVNNRRYSITRSIKDYNNLNESNYESLKEYYDFDYEIEFFIMGLRMNEGVDLIKYKNIFNKDPFIEYPFLDKYIKNGFLNYQNNRLYFTDYGRHLGNILFEEFV